MVLEIGFSVWLLDSAFLFEIQRLDFGFSIFEFVFEVGTVRPPFMPTDSLV